MTGKAAQGRTRRGPCGIAIGPLVSLALDVFAEMVRYLPQAVD
jgi:hypothetical protein